MGHQLVAGAVFLQEGGENYTDLDDYQCVNNIFTLYTTFTILLSEFFFCFSHTHIDTIAKVSLLISRHWVESVNATMQIDIHRTYGYLDPKTGQFSGMSSQLQRKEADIGGRIAHNLKLFMLCCAQWFVYPSLSNQAALFL